MFSREATENFVEDAVTEVVDQTQLPAAHTPLQSASPAGQPWPQTLARQTGAQVPVGVVSAGQTWHDGPHWVASVSGTQRPPHELVPDEQVRGTQLAWFAPPQLVVAAPLGHDAQVPAHALDPAAHAVAMHRFCASQLVAVAPEGHVVQTPLQTREPAAQVVATQLFPLQVVAVTPAVGHAAQTEPHCR